MAIIGYIRVSSNKQTCEHQKYEIAQFAKQNHISIDKWVMETISSRKPLHKRKLGELLNELQPDDILIAAEIAEIESELAKCSDDYNEIDEIIENIVEIAGNAKNLIKSSKTDIKRAFLQLILSNSTITDKKAWISLKKPFDLLKNTNGCLSWLGQLDSLARHSSCAGCGAVVTITMRFTFVIYSLSNQCDFIAWPNCADHDRKLNRHTGG